MVKSRDDNQSAQAPAQQDFESALAQLEALVARMESGALPLEQALQAYEQANTHFRNADDTRLLARSLFSLL